MDWTGYNIYYTKDDFGNNTDDVIKMVTPNGGVIFVPKYSTNRHWQMYQAWLADGNTTQSE